MPSRIILFRFDRHPRVCRSRVALLRRLNPGVPIVGLFGGERGPKYEAFRIGGKAYLGLDELYPSPHPGWWNRTNVDLVLAAWYRDAGHRMPFDIAYLVEWDLLLLAPLERVYAGVPPDALGLTALTPLASIEDEWVWTQRPEDRRQWLELLAHVRDAYGYDDTPYACWGGGPCFPRAYLERYAELDPPGLATEELRVPLFAQILGFPMVSNGLRRSWHSAEEDRFFNNSSLAIDPRVIREELAKPDGARVFHSVRVAFDA
jgi:hypothetical protein